MYIIDKENNKIEKIEAKTFSKLQFREKQNLQEWIANNPDCLDEELLIIQKEFAGFDKTNERLDLLALDKEGNLVIIENKLDDSGRDVNWQAIKYASYCSRLTKRQIIGIYQDYLQRYYNISSKNAAEENICGFFDNQDIESIELNTQINSQRIILVAAEFRAEVLSTALWLMNFKLQIRCIKVTPFEYGGQYLLNFEQIFPTKDMENFIMQIAEKEQEQIDNTSRRSYIFRKKFWEQFIDKCKLQNHLFGNMSASIDNWLRKSKGSGMSIGLTISNNSCSCAFYLDSQDKEKNKERFDLLYAKLKDKIEKAYGQELIWDRCDNMNLCKIKAEINDVSYFDESDWDKINNFLIDACTRLEEALEEPIIKLKLEK